MRLVHISDCHLDHLRHGAIVDFGQRVAAHDVDACIITGDISSAPRLREDLAWFGRGFQKPVFMVLGNHDIYQSSFELVHEGLWSWATVNPLWLESTKYVALSRGTALVGVDGWYDGLAGDIDGSPVEMNDWWHIRELQRKTHWERKNIFKYLGAASSLKARKRIEAAIEDGNRNVILATHVPPYASCSLYRNKPSSPEFAPFYVSQQLGEELTSLAEEHRDVTFTVLAGHTHHVANVRIADNLTVHVAAAEYGAPSVAGIVHVTSEGVRYEEPDTARAS